MKIAWDSSVRQAHSTINYYSGLHSNCSQNQVMTTTFCLAHDQQGNTLTCVRKYQMTTGKYAYGTMLTYPWFVTRKSKSYTNRWLVRIKNCIIVHTIVVTKADWFIVSLVRTVENIYGFCRRKIEVQTWFTFCNSFI